MTLEQAIEKYTDCRKALLDALEKGETGRPLADLMRESVETLELAFRLAGQI